jgi:hypothetical protein
MLAAQLSTSLGTPQQLQHDLGFELGGKLSTVCHRTPPLDLLYSRSMVVQLWGFTTYYYVSVLYCSLLRPVVSERSILWLTRKEVSHATTEMGGQD